jgi:hypothetical protein
LSGQEALGALNAEQKERLRLLKEELEVKDKKKSMSPTQERLAELREGIQQGQGGLNAVMESGLGRIVDDYTNVLNELDGAFGNFFQSVTDGFADSIGRAIVMGEDLEASLKSVAQNALAELISSFVKLGIQMAVNAAIGQTLGAKATAGSVVQAGIVGSAWAGPAALVAVGTLGRAAVPAMAGIASTIGLAKAMSMIPGFEQGGYTGNVGTSEVAGVVHGREFVMNASATARNRDTLEAMNRGQSVSSVGGNVTALNVTVENYGSSEISVEQLSPTDVRIIARDVAKQTVREDAPSVIAGDIGNPNGRVSKSLANNTSVTRKR